MTIHTIDLHFLGFDDTIATFLIETSEGPILIETGPHSTFERLKKGVEEKGFQLADIQHVFLTHIHFDHAGAAWALAEQGSNIYVHRFGRKHLQDPTKLYASAKRIYQDKMELLWGEMKGIPEAQLICPDHEQKIRIGNTTIQAHYTPGHAVHHIAWQIEDQLFAGDVAGVKIREGIVVPPCPPPDIDLEAWQQSIAHIRTLNLQTIWLTHFGPVKQLNEHLSALEERLQAYANWIRPHYEAGREAAEIQGDFEAWVQKDLQDNGIEGIHLQQYQYANPPWMSVAGLLRYWHQKKGNQSA